MLSTTESESKGTKLGFGIIKTNLFKVKVERTQVNEHIHPVVLYYLSLYCLTIEPHSFFMHVSLTSKTF